MKRSALFGVNDSFDQASLTDPTGSTFLCAMLAIPAIFAGVAWVATGAGCKRRV